MTLETRGLDSSNSQRKFVYAFTTNNKIFSCKQNYYYIAILFLCYASLFASKDFACPLLRWIILYFELKRLKKISKIPQSILCRVNKWNLHKCTNILLFDVLTILMHHSVLFFSIFRQKEKFYVKRKNSGQSSCMIFFTFYVGWTHLWRGSLFIKVVSQWIWATRNLLQCYPIFNLS